TEPEPEPEPVAVTGFRKVRSRWLSTSPNRQRINSVYLSNLKCRRGAPKRWGCIVSAGKFQTTGHGLTRGGQERGRGRGRGRGCGRKTGSGGSTLTPTMATDKSESEIEDLSVSSKTSGPSLKETLSEPEVTSNATVKRGRGRAKPRSVSRSRGTSGGSDAKEEIQTTGHGLTRGGQERGRGRGRGCGRKTGSGRGRGRGRGSTLTPAMATDKSESEIEDVSVSSKTSGPSLKETLSGFITTPFSSVLVLHVKDHHYAYVFTQHTQYVEPEVTSNATVKRGRG
ncbi:hypothetical protein GBAR_LOCUS18022, partial [Geodia barretti]